jgi:hypothetical protein
MYNSDTELMFPLRVIPTLSNLRGIDWQKLITKVSSSSSTINEQMAFVLLMVRLGGCITCNADSFRAMRGCTQCASQTVRRFRGADRELIEQYNQYINEVENYLDRRFNDCKLTGV